MLVLKDSKDPISGISKLKLILIYSMNQIKLSSFKEKITEDGGFLELDEEAQTNMLEELDRRSDSIPSSIATRKNSNESEGLLFHGSITPSRNASLVSLASINILADDVLITEDSEKFKLWKKL